MLHMHTSIYQARTTTDNIKFASKV